MTTSAHRARILLGGLAGVGLAASAMTATGVYAPAADVAKTGEARVRSASQQRAVDLKLAMTIPDQTCGARPDSDYSDDLTTPLLTIDNLVLDGPTTFTTVKVCLRNVGATNASIAASGIDIVQTDFACTGDEATVDTTCGANGAGELAPALAFALSPDFSGSTNIFQPSRPVGNLQPGTSGEWAVRVGNNGSATSDQKLAAQSDEIVFRVFFTGSTA